MTYLMTFCDDKDIQTEYAVVGGAIKEDLSHMLKTEHKLLLNKRNTYSRSILSVKPWEMQRVCQMQD